MASPLVEAQIEAQRRLRLIASRAVGQAWRSLGSWDKADVDRFLALAVPAVLAVQRVSVSLTDGYLARALRRPPLGINPDEIIAGLRGGASAEVVYQRPFVNVWSALGNGKPFEDAFNSGLARAESSAATDVQLASFHTAAAVGRADPRIQRYQRVADGSACDFCLEIDGAVLNSEDVQPLHAHCGCSVEPLESDEPLTSLPDTVAVERHGELGPLLVSPADHFTKL